MVRLRTTEPDLPRPYKTPLYPFTPIVAHGLSLVALAAMVWQRPRLAFVYAAILGIAWVAFALYVPRERHTSFE